MSKIYSVGNEQLMRSSMHCTDRQSQHYNGSHNNLVANNTSPCFAAWSGALALNNAAVSSLATRGLFKDAKSLLREAMDLVKISCKQQEGIHDPDDFHLVVTKLNRSYQFISSLSSLQNKRISKIRILDSMDSPSSVTCSLKRDLNLIHVEGNFAALAECSEEQRRWTLDIHSAYILFNYAMLLFIEEIYRCGYIFPQTRMSCLSLLQAVHALLFPKLRTMMGIPHQAACIDIFAMDHAAFLLRGQRGFEEQAAQVEAAAIQMRQHFSSFSTVLHADNYPASAA